MLSNLELPIKEVKHADLQRWSDASPFKSKCPTCDKGILLVYRDDNMGLVEHDRCVNCGQAFQYLDIERLRKLDKGGPALFKAIAKIINFIEHR